VTSIERFAELAPDQQRAVRALADRLEGVSGAPPLNDQSLAQVGAHRPGLVHLLAADDGEVVGYAQRDDSLAELAAPGDLADELLTAVEQAAPGKLTIWTHGTQSPIADAVQGHGYRRTRVLHQLRRPASAAVIDAPLPDGVDVRSFVVGQDEPAWVEVNAAAFATHAEQGRWSAADLIAREAEPWFDPNGFFLAWRDEGLLGFHWTKVHPDGAGEVYVLGVAPAAQGSGLGAALLAVGLRHLASRRCPYVLLYVDESNGAAMRLYERVGFERYDSDAQWQSSANEGLQAS
jgi:mycothiol synthase